MPNPTSVTIDTAGEGDAAAVVALWHSCGLARPWNDPAADFARAMRDAAATVLVARDGAVLVGSIMTGFDGHRGWVYYLAVAPGARRGGTGRTLMAAAEVWLHARGAPKIQLMVRGENRDALAFYAALGLEQQDVLVLGRFFPTEETT